MFGMRNHDRNDYITKMTHVSPGGECPRWIEFIDEVTCGDADYANYLQKLCGYFLVGINNEQAVYFLYGTGANGKSVFVQTLLYVMGDYAVTVPSEMFMTQPFQRHPEELMRLRGTRLVVATEIDPIARWNVARLKQLSGEDEIIARNMRENSISFKFGGKLLIVGNNKPALNGVDKAFRRRIHILPFNAEIDDEHRDKNLAAKLRVEGGGILRWMIIGCQLWQSNGLIRPKVVDDATGDYLDDEDFICQWCDECCDVNPLASAWFSPIAKLYASWKDWAFARNAPVGSINNFSDRLVALKLKASTGSWQLTRHRTNALRGFKQIKLRNADRNNSDDRS